MHPQSSGVFQNSSEILIQNQGHTLGPIGWNGFVNDNVSYQQLDPRDFVLDHPQTCDESGHSNQLMSSQGQLLLQRTISRSHIPSNRCRSPPPQIQY